MSETKSLAQAGYEGYAADTGGKTFDGRAMPVWSALKGHTPRAWQAAARAITARLLGPDLARLIAMAEPYKAVAAEAAQAAADGVPYEGRHVFNERLETAAEHLVDAALRL